jgi:hypothetical protein
MRHDLSRAIEACASALTPLQFMTRVLHRQQTPARNSEVVWIQLVDGALGADMYFCRNRAIFETMADRKSSGSKTPPQETDPRRPQDPPVSGSEGAPGTQKTPKSSPDAAIPPDKLNAENDK